MSEVGVGFIFFGNSIMEGKGELGLFYKQKGIVSFIFIVF